jgi:hypothetical protein
MSNLTEQIIATAAILSAVGVIITTLVTAYRFIRKWDKWREEKDKHDQESYIQILRLVIMTPEMPLSERIAAGDVYVNELNCNGGVKQKYKELLQMFADEHKE